MWSKRKRWWRKGTASWGQSHPPQDMGHSRVLQSLTGEGAHPRRGLFSLGNSSFLFSSPYLCLLPSPPSANFPSLSAEGRGAPHGSLVFEPSLKCSAAWATSFKPHFQSLIGPAYCQVYIQGQSDGVEGVTPYKHCFWSLCHWGNTM